MNLCLFLKESQLVPHLVRDTAGQITGLAFWCANNPSKAVTLGGGQNACHLHNYLTAQVGAQISGSQGCGRSRWEVLVRGLYLSCSAQ